MKTRVILLLFMFFVALISTKAQSIFIYFNNGEDNEYLLSEVSKIAFTESDMLLYKTDDSLMIWPISDIKKFTYIDINTDVSNTKKKNFDVLIYPNPSNGSFKIDYNLPENSDVTISILSMDGRLIESVLSKYLKKGKHSLCWQNNSLPTGTYIVKIQYDNQLTYKKLIISK